MPLPKQVHIGPLTYPIVTDRAVINQATVDSQVTFYANIRFTETDILIDPNQAPPHLRMTLLHEVLHACFHVTMLDKKWEETAVRLLTGPLLDALRRNPELVAFLTETVDPRKGGDERSCGRWFVEGRPWWRHPRWHIWHWRIQWHFGQALHRYLFSRCAGCGKPFAWNEAPTSGWNTPRSSLFRGEQGVYHGACFGKSGAYKRA